MMKTMAQELMTEIRKDEGVLPELLLSITKNKYFSNEIILDCIFELSKEIDALKKEVSRINSGVPKAEGYHCIL